MKANFPHTRTVDVVDVKHNQRIPDPYQWLEEDTPGRTKWIQAQNSYTNRFTKNIHGRKAIRGRLEEMFFVDTIGSPTVKKNRIIYSKQGKDQQQSVVCIRDWPDGKGKVLLDPNQLSDDGSIALAGTSTTLDGKLMAYALNKDGSDWFKLRIMDVDSGNDLSDEIPRLAYTGIGWLPNNSGFYYSRSEHNIADKLTKTNHRLFFHKLGNDWRKDEIVFGKGLKGREKPTVMEISEDGRFVIFGVRKDFNENELYYLDRFDGNQKIKPITSGQKGNYFAVIENDKLYVLTDNNAPKFRLCSVELDGSAPTMEKWKTIIREDNQSVLQDFSVFSDRVYVKRKRNVVSNIEEYTLDGKLSHNIELSTLGSASVPRGREEMDAVFLTFSSFFHPLTTYKFDLKTRNLSEWTKNEYPFDPSEYTTEQIWYKSKDGTEVPMFVVRKSDAKLDGNNPTILTGYGGFNGGEYPYFSPSRILWLEHGGMIAIANLRGGDEFGEEWHQAGMLDKKQNVFDDFIGAGEALIGERPSRMTDKKTYAKREYANSERLGTSGGSNGGLLVGAALVQRPDLWGAVYCDAPLLDMTKFHLTEGGKYWTGELGDPENPEHLPFLLKYSPYHNVAKGASYPTVMFRTSLGDDGGVDPMHAMKMAAKVQAYNASDNQIFLKVLEKTGHGHSKPKSMIVEELVDYYAFMGKYLGMNWSK